MKTTMIIYIDNCYTVGRNEGRLWATGWQGQMTAYVKHETSNCGACVNDAIYLFYSIFFMSLPRHVLGKTIFFGKAIYLGKAISLTYTCKKIKVSKNREHNLLQPLFISQKR